MEALLQTKLFVPKKRPFLIPRPRLISLLNQSLDGKLTLVSAPAGFGKTTLITEWLQHRPTAETTWLSLDAEDKNLNRFLRYLIGALQTKTADFGLATLGALNSSQPPPTATILTLLLNEMAALPNAIVLVLDDYHLVDSPAVDEAVAFLLDHLPPAVHIVITTREDPPWPLSRLRARRELTEIRSTDLRFTLAEVTKFLNEAMAFDLSTEAVEALLSRTEGWITGLQLAAIAMQGQTDKASFIEAFTGSHRFVLDYLVEEVLDQVSAEVRTFLLQTAFLPKLNAALCDAVTQQTTSEIRLRSLERENLFLIPLDDARYWYRYHHLFAEVLQAHAQATMADRLPSLHLQAAVWFEDHNLFNDAIYHAVAGNHAEKTADLLEKQWPESEMTYQATGWLEALATVPPSLIEKRPNLCVNTAWSLLASGDMEQSEQWLQKAERFLRPQSQLSNMQVADPVQLKSLPASIYMARAYRALAIGDVAATIRFAEQVLDQPAALNARWQMGATSLLGLAQYISGDLVRADQSLSAFQASCRRMGNNIEAISISFTLAEIKQILGRLQEAVQLYEQSIQWAKEESNPLPIGTADLYRGLSELSLEQGNLETAVTQLALGKKLGQDAALTNWPYRLAISEAMLMEAQGNFADALALLNKAERLYIRTPLPNVHPVTARTVRLRLRLGQLDEVRRWEAKQNAVTHNSVPFVETFNQLTLAHLHLVQLQRFQESAMAESLTQRLQRLIQDAEGGKRDGHLIELLILQALAHQAVGNPKEARPPLKKALMLAEPERFVRLFTVHPTLSRPLLTKLKSEVGGKLLAFVDRILAVIEAENGRFPTNNRPPALIEPLSDREQEILQLIAQGLSNRAISEQLFLALSTVKGHNRVLFGKLHVQNRTEAVARARELGLL